MKKNFAVFTIIVSTSLLVMACAISMDGIDWSGDIETPDPMAEYIGTIRAEGTEEASGSAADMPEPEYQPADSSGSDNLNPETANASSHEYSAISTNFDCICQNSANNTVDFNFTGDQVEITRGGGATVVFDKIGENTYQRTDMNYYILRTVEGDPTTDTKVDREDKTVIILTSNGYVMEYYQGSSSSPCCYYTFTIEK